jgi:LmbE family N-acetylglucosaminyl deacetylase
MTQRFGCQLAMLAMLATPLSTFAQEPTMDAGRLAHALDRLSNTARVLYVAAHPDDENTRLLAYLANARHVSAQYLAMTRGGGGQNLIGSEQDALLDVLRTQELLAARRLDGASQRFSRMRDFGYSKSAQETLSVWGHDEALADVVFAYRSFRPDVVITRFDENPPNHGHHTASAILAREAFTAAADPTKFPEQIKAGLKPWQPKRLLYNYASWKGSPPSAALMLDVGSYDVRLGLSYGELAARSRSQHKSQGFGAAPERGKLPEYFVWVAGEPVKHDILDGVDGTWAGRFGAPGKAVDAALAEARRVLHRDFPEHATPPLAAARRALDALPGDDPRVVSAKKQSERLALLASGVFVRALAPRPACTPGSNLPVRVEVVLRRPSQLQLTRVRLPDGSALTPGGPFADNDKHELIGTLHCGEDMPISTPYWLAQPPEPGHFVLADERALDDPAGPAPLTAAAEFNLNGQPLSLPAPLVAAFTDRVQGERERDVLVVPPLSLTPVRQAIMFPNDAKANVAIRVRAGADGVTGRVLLELPSGYASAPAEHDVHLDHAGDETVVQFAVTPAGGAHAGTAKPVAIVGDRRWSLREDVIDYPHVPVQVVLRPAQLLLRPLTLTAPRGTIGYVEGSGDSVAADLAHIGATVETLSDAALLSGNLSRFSAIVLGVRSYNTRDVLKRAQPRLMKYVKDGGTLLVQYVTRSNISPLDIAIGPYPLEIGRGRVTDEHAEMKVHPPESVVLRSPHRIGPHDFEGWVQERGLYFADTWDDKYQSVFEVADPGEAPQRGALLVAHYGRGRYVYTGLSFFRQLPAGVPGAYRLFVNLLAPESAPAP